MKKKIKTRRAAPVKPPAAKPPRLMKVVSREPYGRRALIALAAEIFSERGYEAASHDGMKDPLAESIEAIIARSEAIAALAMDADKPLSSAFSKKENVNTTDISIAFMTAIAGTASIEDVRALKPEIERMRDKVLATSEAVADRIRDNPLMLSGFVNGLQTLFRLLLDADPTIRVVAGFAFPAAVRQFLRTNSMEENLNRQIKQRTRLIPAFPNVSSLLRLVSAICAEISDDWETSSYRYMSTIKEL